MPVPQIKGCRDADAAYSGQFTVAKIAGRSGEPRLHKAEHLARKGMGIGDVTVQPDAAGEIRQQKICRPATDLDPDGIDAVLVVDLSRFRAAPGARLSHLPFEIGLAFPAKC